MIIGVDLNNVQEGAGAQRFGMTHFVNPDVEIGDDIVP